MGIFSHKENNELFELLESDRPPLSEQETAAKRAEISAHTHALTPDEVLSKLGSDITDSAAREKSDPMQSLRNRMLNGSQNNCPTPKEQPDRPEAAGDSAENTCVAKKAIPEKDNVAPPQNKGAASENVASFLAQFASPPAQMQKKQPDSDQQGLKGSESVQKKNNNAPDKKAVPVVLPVKPDKENPVVDAKSSVSPNTSAEPQKGQKFATVPHKHKKSLFEKCKPYIVDDNGVDATAPQQPLYKLESVAEILQTGDQRTLDTLSEKYNITVDNLGAATKDEKPLQQNKKTKDPSPADSPAASPVLKTPSGDEKEREVYEEFLPGSLPDISDIDNKVAPKEKPSEPMADETATIRFTPIKDSDTDSEHISVSTHTRAIDLTGELGDLSMPQVQETDDTRLEGTEFEDFEPDDEYTGPADTKRLIHKLSLKKRSSFLRTLLSAVALLAIAAFLLPFLSDMLLRSTRTAMIICSSVLAAAVLINFDMFAAFPKMLDDRSCTDCNACLAAIGGLLLGGAAIYTGENEYEMLLLCIVILFVRSLTRFLDRSALLGNLKQIATPAQKKAVVLLSDEATTFAMAKNAIEGDALIAVPRKTDAVADFMKYSEFSPVLGSKLRIITISSAVLSVATGLAAAAFFNGMIYGFYTAAVILCLAALPSLFLIDVLPCSAAAKKLNRKGSMIAGKAAAERLELSNAAVFSSHEIFPDGTVTLHNMKVLSENNFDETILRAASLTDAVDSPLAPIFKKIAGTSSAYQMPDSDTVKYEATLGLSGWVDNKLLFIGNRTLMESHGIAVPDVEIDRKILRKGYFPVYLASDSKACALIVIQYTVDPNVAHELRRLTAMGVTLLISNCDPNLTEEMICDYLGLFEDSVRIMSNAGVHMYRNAVTETTSCSAPAVFRGNPLNFIYLLNCASRIKKSNTFLTFTHIFAMCVGIVLFAYISFSGSGLPPQGITVLVYELAATAVAYLLFLFKKP